MRLFLIKSPKGPTSFFMSAAALHSMTSPLCAQDNASSPLGDVVLVQGEQEGMRSTQVADSNAPEILYPDDFRNFSPRNALDLIEQIPGFTLDGSDGSGGGGGRSGSNTRGFGQASTNLLINGTRLSSKSTSARDELSRIPVSGVVRIEIVDGASLNVPGLSGQVANVIVTNSGTSGQFRWNPQFSFGPADTLWSRGEVSLRGSAGGMNFTLAFDSRGSRRGGEGLATFTDAEGVIDERFNVQTRRFNRPTLRSSVAFDVAPDIPVNINASASLGILREYETEGRVEGNPLPALRESFRTTSDQYRYELSGDIVFPVGPGRLKLIALENFEHQNRPSTALQYIDDEVVDGSRFQRNSNRGERIGRAEYSWGMLSGDWQLAAEAAFNRLDQVGSLFDYHVAEGNFIEVALPNASGGVREERYESILSYGTPITDDLSIQVAVGAEQSTLSQTGTNTLSRTFQRPKGSVSLAWAATEDLHVSLEVARRVGQLEFNDFLATVNLSEENENSGNAQLRPQQSWETELEFSKSFGRWGSATLSLFDQRIEDFVTIVPVMGGESSGNIESARRYGLNLNGTLMFDQLGWDGMRLDVNLGVERSSMADPVTLVSRRFDRSQPFDIQLDFRHDIPQTDWAWGWGFRQTEFAPSFRRSQISLSYDMAAADAKVFVEHKNLFGLLVRAELTNIFNGAAVLDRTVFAGARDTAPILFVEDRRLYREPEVQIIISGNF